MIKTTVVDFLVTYLVSEIGDEERTRKINYLDQQMHRTNDILFYDYRPIFFQFIQI